MLGLPYATSNNVSPFSDYWTVSPLTSLVGRPQAHPNYGFIKQLDTYAKCQFEPSSSNPVYRSWKKRQEQDVTYFLNQLVDTVSIIPDKLLLNRYAVQGALDVKESIHGLNISVVRLFADSILTYIFHLVPPPISVTIFNLDLLSLDCQ